MLRELTWSQFLELQAYDKISPIGDRRSDWQSASICSAIMNSVAIAHRSRKRWQPKDFLLKFQDVSTSSASVVEKPADKLARMKWIAKSFTAMANADVSRKAKRDGRRKKR